MKKILLATDGSKPAFEAAQFLAHLPHDEQVELTVLSVIEPPVVSFSYRVEDWIKEAAESEKAAAAETFKQVQRLFDAANVTIRHVVKEGARGEKIASPLVAFPRPRRLELIRESGGGNQANHQ